ncbi:MAG TPA: lactate racemase domain-containing protein [Terriglobia bacterium]|nr:lactate racemase domain-containing protein [Terriglobia bacterium]
MKSNGQVSLAHFQILERVSATVPAIENLEEELYSALSALNLPREQLKDRTIAVTVGSRGVASVREIARGICGWLKSQGANPFVFPAMGSHGGATTEGQLKILEEYGVTEQFIGAPIRASMETISLGVSAEGVPVFMDRLASQSDGVVVMNRVKPHTTFSGTVESGMLKMMAVGMGKEDGARAFHAAARKLGYERAVRAMSVNVLTSGKILCGVGVIENEMHRICAVRAARTEDIVPLDEQCLLRARRLVPRIPFPKVQLLIVNEMGKNISGTGMDSKVIGRGVPLQPGEAPEIELIYARDLTEASGGNALGVGLADFVHERLRNKIDFEKMYVNARTSMSHQLVRLPMVLKSDREALAFAIASLNNPPASEQSVVWIDSTQNLDRIAISERVAREASSLEGWRLKEDVTEPRFDVNCDLVSIP